MTKSCTVSSPHQITLMWIAALALLVPLGAGANEESTVPPQDQWNNLTPVTLARLDTLRGGFEVAPGLSLSFGFERAVYINGELVASSRLALSGGTASASNTPSASALAAAGTALSNQGLIVNNGGSSIRLPTSTTFISGVQNTLNNQTIQVRTTIDATLSSLSQFRAQLFSDAFRQSTIDSARR